MNRTIKFRIWDKDKKKFIHSGDLFYITLLTHYFTHGAEACNEDFIIQESLDRFDVDGKEIFEGDIVKKLNKPEYCKKEYLHPVYRVGKDSLGLILKHIGGDKSSDSHHFNMRYYSDTFKVIGHVNKMPKIKNLIKEKE